MRFNVSSSALSSRLISLSKVINAKNTMAILDSFLFEVHNGQIVITASDSENTMNTVLPLENCEGEGDFTVSAHTVIDAVKELPEQPLNIEVNMDESKTYISYQNGKYNFPIQGAEEYLRMQGFTGNVTVVNIDSSMVNECITRSLFATASDELRPVMNGVYFDFTPDALAIVASDGHKLVRNMLLSIKSETPSAFILPKKPANLLKNVLGKDGGDMEIKFDERMAEIRYSDGCLSCRLIEGRYPNYGSVIPQNNPNQLTVDRKSLLGGLRRVLPFASESSELIKLHIEDGRLELSAEDIDFATNAVENITCSYIGMPMNIGFKGSSLVDILNNISGDDVVLELADPSRAGLVLPAEQPENQNVLMLLMPMLLND